jgi:hypothetical protein
MACGSPSAPQNGRQKRPRSSCLLGVDPLHDGGDGSGYSIVLVVVSVRVRWDLCMRWSTRQLAPWRFVLDGSTVC